MCLDSRRVDDVETGVIAVTSVIDDSPFATCISIKYLNLIVSRDVKTVVGRLKNVVLLLVVGDRDVVGVDEIHEIAVGIECCGTHLSAEVAACVVGYSDSHADVVAEPDLAGYADI